VRVDKKESIYARWKEHIGLSFKMKKRELKKKENKGVQSHRKKRKRSVCERCMEAGSCEL